MLDHQKKWIYFLPNTFTCLNMACGYAAIMMAIKGDLYKACLLLILGAIFDSVDGRVARLTGTQSSFGEQFDSMSDLISFGFAPAFLYYERFLVPYGRFGMVLAFLFLLAGALRLARFNANLSKISSDYFQGLPIPFGAMSLVGFILLSIDIEAQFNLANFPALIFLYIFFYSVLMISNLPFPSFKKSEWAKHHVKLVLLMIFLLLASIAVYEERMVVVIITLYVVGSFAYYLSHRAHFKGIFSGEKKTEIH